LAIDQRSGNEVNGVVNEAAANARLKGLATEYSDAMPDLKATLMFAKQQFPNKKIIIWGSSYSSSLVLILASEMKDDISAVLSFSPGEYFTFNDKKIAEYAQNITIPVFITSAGNEENYWREIFDVIPSVNKMSYLPHFTGQHGSKALWEQNEGHAKYWEEVSAFLTQLK
jgi:hypothetical protein